MKNSQGFSSRFEDSEGRISKLEDRIVKGTQTEEKKKEKKEKWTEPKGLLGLLSGPKYALWESQKEKRERERSIENICRVIATDFPNLIKNMNPCT